MSAFSGARELFMNRPNVSHGGVEDASWPYIIYFTFAYTTAPLYILIIIRLIRHRKTTHFTSIFYTLVISQGIADLFYIACYTVFIVLATVATDREVDHFFEYTVANISYKALYYTLSLRCFGVTLISLQRYLCICKWNTYFNERLNKIPPILVALTHWTASLLFVIPIFTMTSIRFGCVCKKLVAMDPMDFRTSTVNAEALVLIMFVAERQQGIRLCAPVAALVLAFFLIFVYHFIQMISIIITGNQFLPVRVLEPLFIGFLTFITPWSMLFFNDDVSRLFNFRLPRKTAVMHKNNISVYSPTGMQTTGHFY